MLRLRLRLPLQQRRLGLGLGLDSRTASGAPQSAVRYSSFSSW